MSQGRGRLEHSHLSHLDRRTQTLLTAAIAAAAFAAALGLGLVPVPDSWRRATIRLLRPPPPVAAPAPAAPGERQPDAG